ncbi:hypothetical protein M9Y10_018589 [Tritrichomonas musculus]|uniref:Protein kinase domain-containing protein n=1 Tax=Tritrichomonas musculus TaxID=1915356 RepID=A0ABR2HMS8_9EUKA
MEFYIKYKTAIDYARQKNYREIVELLSKGPIKRKEEIKKEAVSSQKKETEKLPKTSEYTDSLKKENELPRQKTQKQEEEIHKKEEENRKKADEIHKKEEENKKQADEIELLKSLLFSSKENPSTLQIVDYRDYDVESVIGEGGTSSVKIVTKKEKYAQKEISFEQVKRILSEFEILVILRHPCIIRVFGFSHGDDTHPPSIILSLESTSLEKAIEDKKLNEEEKNRITRRNSDLC